MSKYKFLGARGQIIFAKNFPWWLGNVQLVLIVAVVEVYLQEDSFHFYIKKISAGRLRGFNSRSFSPNMKVYNNNQLYKSPAGDQLWNSGRQNWIFGHIGDQEGAISDPVGIPVVVRNVSCFLELNSCSDMWDILQVTQSFSICTWALRPTCNEKIKVPVHVIHEKTLVS